MEKEAYLVKVQPFINWLSENLYNETLEHSYINRRNSQPVCFASIYDAFEKYQWSHPAIDRLHVPKGNTFASNAEALGALRENLRASIKNESDEGTCQAAVDVMSWGGVTLGNTSWLIANTNGLAVRLAEIRDGLDSGNSRHQSLIDRTLRFNAGMTKVYSLISKDFIIYDSRVAAALGLAIAKYVESGNSMVQELGFPWSPAKEGKNARNPKNRDPGTGELKFPRLREGPLHAEWNLKASWLLCAVIEQDKKKQGKFAQLDEPLRGLEAALFMIGYDLPGLPVTADDALRDNDELPLSSDLYPGPWTDCWTLVHRNPFEYRLTDGGVEVRNGRKYPDEIVNGTLSKLWNYFGNEAFPLQNSLTAVPDGTAEMGLGVAYYQTCQRNPPDTSRLAAVLEDQQILLRVHVENSRGLHWKINSDLLGLSSKVSVVDVRSILNQIRERDAEA